MTTRNSRSFISTRIWSAAKRAIADTARDILDYVLRDMTHPDGGFYSAEDADSEGHEGKFYCWTQAELSQAAHAGGIQRGGPRYFGITDGRQFC